MTDAVLKNYSNGFSVLYVEDDPVGATIIRLMLERFFDKVYGAENGLEGLQQFRQHQPDLIVTDLMMPVMDGISMLREIRKIDQRTPVLLMTASLEHIHLVEAINLGVSKFLAKPVRADALQRALLSVTRELHMERVAEQSRQQEVELLQYRNRYHSRQQELAQAKERHIVNNQMKDCFLPVGENGGWLVDLQQHPRDIMSGDSYAIIRTSSDTLLIFLADAMGHGLSASVTSMLATAFFSYAATECSPVGLGFAPVAQRTMQFASRNLLEDEVFSGLVMELDPLQQVARMVCCGMPALLLVRNGQVERVCGLNPPVSAFLMPVQVQELSLEGVSDILLASDGLGDAAMVAGGSYRDRLLDDLLATVTASELFGRYEQYCNDCDNDDDITLIRLTASEALRTGCRYRFTSPGTLGGISGLQRQVREQLEAAGVGGDRLDLLELALGEALLNAFEHGCLGLGADKQRLLLEGDYDDMVMAAVPDQHTQITLTLTLLQRQERLQAWVEVADPGPGCNPHQQFCQGAAPTAVSGRGFRMMQRSVDLVRMNPAGNRLLLMQMFDGG